MTINANTITTILGWTAAACATGYAIATQNKMNQVATLLSDSVDELIQSKEIDIPDSMIEQAVERAIRNRANMSIDKAVNTITKEVSADMKRQVKSIIDEHYMNIKDDVLAETKKQVSALDIRRLRDEVYRDAKSAAAQKLDDRMEDILENFNSELESVSKIYKSIQETLTKDDKIPVIRLG